MLLWVSDLSEKHPAASGLGERWSIPKGHPTATLLPIRPRYPGGPGLTLGGGGLVPRRDAQSRGNPSPASMLGSRAGVAMEGAAPGISAARGFFS